MNENEPTYIDADLDLVSETMACPKCGERRVDWLACGDDEREDVVTCGTCGYVYEVGAA